MAARTDNALRGIGQQAKAWMKAYGVPGMCLAITSRIRTLKPGAYGFSSIDSEMPLVLRLETKHLD